MSDSRPTSDPAIDLTEIAAGWLAALDAGTADRRAFEAWRDADVRHAVAFAEVASTWRDLNALSRIQGDPAPAIPDDRSACSHREGLARRPILRAAFAAGVMAVAGGGFAMRAAARNKAETGIGERRSVSDVPGLSVNLNTDSSVYWKGGTSPRLWLERGEIGIRLDPGRRISLTTPGGTFHLAPGDYNARLRGSSCELAVLSGSGTLEDAVRPFRPGDIALATAGQASVRQREADLSRVTAWRRDTLVLNGESLDYALAEMNRYLHGKILIGDPGLSRLRIGGTFATTDPAEFLDALRTAFGVKATAAADGTIVLTRA